MTEEEIHDIQNSFRMEPHYPTVEKLADKYHCTIRDIINTVNLNPKIGAFIYRESVYTYRHIRQIRGLQRTDTPMGRIWEIMGIAGTSGWKLFMQKEKELTEMEESEERRKKAEAEAIERVRIIREHRERERIERERIERERAESEKIEKEEPKSEPNNIITKESKPMTVDYTERDKKVLELYKKGLTQQKIADTLGMSRGNIERAYRRLRSAGIIPPVQKTAETQAPEKKEVLHEKSHFVPNYKDVVKDIGDAPDNDGDKKKYKKITRVESIDKIAAELVRKLKVSKSCVGRALSVARDAVEYAFKFGEVKEYTISGSENFLFADSKVTITLRGADYDITINRKI